MKKLLIVLLTIAMVLGMSGTAFAIGDDNEYTDMGSITIKKVVNGSGNPEETFNFTIGAGEVLEGSAESAPVFSQNDFSITVGKGENEGTKVVNLPDNFTKVGTYSYPITETVKDTAGMVYDTEDKELVITVINDGNGGLIRLVKMLNVETQKKVDDFVNTFNSGNLYFKKVLEGNYTDPNDEFTVTVTLTAVEGKTLNPSAIVTNGAVSAGWDNENYVIVYKVNGGDKKDFTIQNIPYNVDYTVVETGFDGYDPKYIVSYDNANGEMNAELIETTITNTRGIDVEVGVTLDNLPYVLTLVMALGGLVVFVLRKRIFN